MKKNILKTVSEKIQHIWKKSDKLSVQDSKKAVSDPEKKIKESIQKKEDIQIEKARQRRWSDFDFDKTDGEAFEYFCADLLRANGFTNVELTKKTGDLGVDILAEKEQITYRESGCPGRIQRERMLSLHDRSSDDESFFYESGCEACDRTQYFVVGSGIFVSTDKKCRKECL